MSPIRSVVLHDAGVPVLVPGPERYAVHKLIIATKRNVFFADKAKKDINQAGALIQTFNAVKRSSDLGFADGRVGTRSQMATMAWCWRPAFFG